MLGAAVFPMPALIAEIAGKGGDSCCGSGTYVRPDAPTQSVCANVVPFRATPTDQHEEPAYPQGMPPQAGCCCGSCTTPSRGSSVEEGDGNIHPQEPSARRISDCVSGVYWTTAAPVP